MGYKEIELRIPVQVHQNELEIYVRKSTGIKDFSFQILRKSLDARNKRKICWQYKLGLESPEIKQGQKPEIPSLLIPKKKYSSTAVVIGSGPAGIFSALLLAESGMKVTLIERGSQVIKRKHSLDHFEKTGMFDASNNYAFGEGGAGTFSDGKLTSRTKGISKERNYIYNNFVEAGAPGEIIYMTHPHLGSDNLLTITVNLRNKLINLGGEILFDTLLEDINISNNRIKSITTSKGIFNADIFIIATGHSAYETYRMLIRRKVAYQNKNFAIGMRAEHPQQVINEAQWGVESLPTVKAAEYRLTASLEDNTPVYSFCMCPGGVIVPAAAYADTNIVNGMSYYKRNGNFANAAVVSGVHADKLLNKQVHPLETLDYIEKLEQKFFQFTKSFDAPSVRISDFLKKQNSKNLPSSSYPFNLVPANLSELLPEPVINNMASGIKQFCNKLRGYEQGILVGLESKTSSPIQVVRNKETFQCTYDNLYLAGEGSGWAGGIISSAADGLKVASKVLETAK
jgi:uncharacterized FAD-dependent dehydrogenase